MCLDYEFFILVSWLLSLEGCLLLEIKSYFYLGLVLSLVPSWYNSKTVKLI